jgi:hypothetical protein
MCFTLFPVVRFVDDPFTRQSLRATNQIWNIGCLLAGHRSLIGGLAFKAWCICCTRFHASSTTNLYIYDAEGDFSARHWRQRF